MCQEVFERPPVAKDHFDSTHAKGRQWLTARAKTKECENALDYYEDYPNLYRKKYLSLDGYNEPILTYVMNPGYGIGPPSTLYFNAIKDGYKDWNIKINDFGEISLNN